MEPYLQPKAEEIRISSSPRRSPQINQGLRSPTRSVHPQMQQLDSIHSQPDFGLRTADFFEDSSEDEAANGTSTHAIAPDMDMGERRGSASRRRRTTSTVEPFASQCESKPARPNHDYGGYQPLQGRHEDIGVLEPASSSFNGSVDELLPSGRHSSPPQVTSAPRNLSGRTPPNPTHIETSDDQQSMPSSTRVDPTLGAYAIAHEITLQALMRDEVALDRSLQSFALTPMQPGDHNSILPASLDPRSPRARNFSSTPTPKKTVHVVPPPIDISAPRRSIPEDIVRTPYPFSPDNVRRKDFGKASPPPANAKLPNPNTESILTLSIRRSNPNSKIRITSLNIPAANDFVALRSGSIGAKERHFKSLDFDDAEFFRGIRRCYYELSGPMRFLSARSLRRIAVTGPATKAADIGYGWRSPRVLAYKGLSDTFSEEQILQHFRKPELGKSRYAFIHWAHRLTATPSTHGVHEAEEGPRGDSTGQLNQPEGLEFVLSWSVARIVSVHLIVLSISIAALLLWIFLGRNTVGAFPPQGGYRDSGDRLATGILIGICMLLVGLSSIAGWLGVSWLLM